MATRTGYERYWSTLAPPKGYEYGEASSDDLSSDWETDSEKSNQKPKASPWKKLRNVVHWSPFIQTYKKHKYPWIQLAGHQGNFKAGSNGNILKKFNSREEICLQQLMEDTSIRRFVPTYRGKVESQEENEPCFLELQDLLADFDNPCVLDIKMGIRTYLEDELNRAREKPKLRKDMYEKMIQINKDAPTEEEHRLKAVTKPRYMVWRETISSTASLGFRIEGLKLSDGLTSKDFKTTKTIDQVYDIAKKFIDGYPHVKVQYLEKLKELRKALVISSFFRNHEVIGSSLLFVHDQSHSGVWMIDFAKTWPVENSLQHDIWWTLGNHEDGYLIGLDNLINLFQQL